MTDGRDWRDRSWLVFGGITLAVLAFALFRPMDHDESQYVAAAVLTAHGWLPYRDYAYLQTPLQPFVLAPVAWLAGALAWPALRLANALFGVATIVFTWRAARTAGAAARPALAAAALLASCDILMFGITTARNDALPAMLFTAGLWALLAQAPPRRAGWLAGLAGLLFAAAAAAKISYAIPAGAAGLYALATRRRPWWLAAGALPMLLLVAWTWRLAPTGFVFGTLSFPARAPALYYADRPWKLSLAAKLVDSIKFLLLGPALAVLVMVARRRPDWRGAVPWLIVAGLVAALLPTPTWRQYLIPLLPPLFVQAARLWTKAPPGRVAIRLLAALAGVGLLPTLLSFGMPTLVSANAESRAIGSALRRHGVTGPVATLAPQFLPAAGALPDRRFAAGPFLFRTHGLVTPAAARSLGAVTLDTLPTDALPAAVLIGGEGLWASGNPDLDRKLEARAQATGYIRAAETRHLQLYLKPQR